MFTTYGGKDSGIAIKADDEIINHLMLAVNDVLC